MFEEWGHDILWFVCRRAWERWRDWDTSLRKDWPALTHSQNQWLPLTAKPFAMCTLAIFVLPASKKANKICPVNSPRANQSPATLTFLVCILCLQFWFLPPSPLFMSSHCLPTALQLSIFWSQFKPIPRRDLSPWPWAILSNLSSPMSLSDTMTQFVQHTVPLQSSCYMPSSVSSL